MAGGAGWRAALEVAVPERKGFALHSDAEITAVLEQLRRQAAEGIAVSKHGDAQPMSGGGDAGDNNNSAEA